MSLALSVSGLLGGIVLLCGFMQLYQRRVGAMITLSQLASLALAFLALSRAILQHEAGFYLVAGLVAGEAGIGLPWCLRRVAARYGQPVAVLPMAMRLVLGVLLVAVAVAVVPAVYQNMALALAVLLLAMLLMLVQAHPLIWLIGAFAMANGLVLALLTLPSLPNLAVWVGLLLLLPLGSAGVLVGRGPQEAAL